MVEVYVPVGATAGGGGGDAIGAQARLSLGLGQRGPGCAGEGSEAESGDGCSEELQTKFLSKTLACITRWRDTFIVYSMRAKGELLTTPAHGFIPAILELCLSW